LIWKGHSLIWFLMLIRDHAEHFSNLRHFMSVCAFILCQSDEFFGPEKRWGEFKISKSYFSSLLTWKILVQRTDWLRSYILVNQEKQIEVNSNSLGQLYWILKNYLSSCHVTKPCLQTWQSPLQNTIGWLESNINLQSTIGYE